MKVEEGTLDRDDLFEYRGVIYEVLYKTDYCVRCQYPNDKYRYGDIWEYLYTEFSLWTKVNKGSINCKYLRLVATRKNILIEKRTQVNL